MAQQFNKKNKVKTTVYPKALKQKEQAAFIENKMLWLALGVALLATFISFIGITNNELTNWDDPTYITNNPLIKSLSTTNIKRIFSETYFANYQPIQILSYAIEYHFFGLKASGYHWVSLIQHLINTGLVMWLSWSLSRNNWVSFITALLFGIHPMHVESVAWAAERKDLLYAMFLFASLIAYVIYVKSNFGFLYLLISFILFTFSIFSKTMAVSLIPILFLMDWYLNRKFTVKSVVEKLPFVALAFLMGYIATRNAVETGSVDTAVFYSQVDRIVFGFNNLMMYVLKSIIPFNLSGYYQYPDLISGGIPSTYYYSIPVILALAVAVFYSLKYNKHVLFAGGFFVASIILVLQIFPVGPTLFSERYSYIPSFGLNFLIGLGMVNLMQYYGNSSNIKTFVYTITGCYSIWLIAYTKQRCEIWKDSISFWTDVIRADEKIPVAYNNRGNEYKMMENFELAIPDLNKAIEYKPDYMEPHAILGDIYRQQAKYDLAMMNLNTAIKIDPKSASALVNRGIVYAILGKNDSARFDFNSAIKFKPEMFEAWGNRGNLNAIEKNREQALSDYQNAIAINPDFKDAYRNLGLLSFELNKLDNAIGYFNQYIEIGTRETNRVLNPQIYFDLARTYAQKNDFVNAVNYAELAKQNGFAVNADQIQQWRNMIK